MALSDESLEKLFFCNRRCPKNVVAKERLLCFPSACSDVFFFKQYKDHLSPSIEMHTLSLPGRSVRGKEKAYEDVQFLLRDIVQAIVTQFSDLPFSFFGHSFGAMLAYYVTIKLQNDERQLRKPSTLFLSSTPAPHSQRRVTLLTDTNGITWEQAKQYLIEQGGIPSVMQDDNEYLDRVVIRPFLSDANLNQQLGTMNDSEVPRVFCPIKFFYGNEDIDHDVQAWSEVTSELGAFSSTEFPGGHQFLLEKENCKEIVGQINLQTNTVD